MDAIAAFGKTAIGVGAGVRLLTALRSRHLVHIRARFAAAPSPTVLESAVRNNVHRAMV